MDEKESLFKLIERSRKKQVVFLCVSMTSLCLLYVICINVVSKSFEILDDDFSWVYQIDSIEERDGILEISGWAFELEQEAKEEAFGIILRNTETGKRHYSKMQYRIRDDVNEYFLCEYDYSKSGFTATVPIETLDNATYEIILKPTNVRKAYSTEIYVVEGAISFVHPNEFLMLNVEGTDLENIVDDGELRMYRPEVGMYIYQYNNALYWIAENKYELDGLGSWIQFHLNTTQIDKLPEERLENGWYWSNLSFYYQENEITTWNTGKYRVSKYDLPTDYSIYQIFTGRYDEDWIWRDDFRPVYTFQ